MSVAFAENRQGKAAPDAEAPERVQQWTMLGFQA